MYPLLMTKVMLRMRWGQVLLFFELLPDKFGYLVTIP